VSCGLQNRYFACRVTQRIPTLQLTPGVLCTRECYDHVLFILSRFNSRKEHTIIGTHVYMDTWVSRGLYLFSVDVVFRVRKTTIKRIRLQSSGYHLVVVFRMMTKCMLYISTLVRNIHIALVHARYHDQGYMNRCPQTGD
jgi:hypothetical protein